MEIKKYGGVMSSDFLEQGRKTGLTDDAIADQMAMSSPNFASQLKKIRTKFGGDPAATAAFLNTRFYGDTTYTPEAPPEKKGFVGRTLDRIYNAGLGLRQQLDDYNAGEISSGQAVVRGAAEIGSGILSPALEASSTVIGGAMRATGLDQGIRNVAQEVAQSDVGQTVAPYVNKAAQTFQDSPKSSWMRDAAAVGKFGIDALDFYGSGQALKLGTQGLKAAGHAVRHPIQTVRGQSRQVGELQGSAKAAVDKGMDEKFMSFVAGQNADTRAVMAKMTTEAERGSKLLGGTTRHKEVLGGQMLDNIAYVMDEKQTVGKALNAMKAAVADEPVNLTDDLMKFVEELRNKGAVVDDKGKIRALAGASDDNIPLLQQTLDFLMPDDAGNVIRRGREVDLWRQKMFQEMNSAKAKLQPSSAGQSALGFAEKVTNNIRRAALNRMAKGNSRMIAANDAYEELATETSKFLKAIQYKGKLSVDEITGKQLRAGEVALRTLGNAAGEPRAAFESLIATARKYGRKSTVDEMALIRYVDALEDVFPIAPTRSLRGEVSRGSRDAMGNMTQDIIESGGSKVGILNRISEPAMKVYDKMRGLTPENRFKLLMEVLEAPPETEFFSIMDDVLPDAEVDKIGKATVKGVVAAEMVPVAKAVLETEE